MVTASHVPTHDAAPRVSGLVLVALPLPALPAALQNASVGQLRTACHACHCLRECIIQIMTIDGCGWKRLTLTRTPRTCRESLSARVPRAGSTRAAIAHSYIQNYNECSQSPAPIRAFCVYECVCMLIVQRQCIVRFEAHYLLSKSLVLFELNAR